MRFMSQRIQAQVKKTYIYICLSLNIYIYISQSDTKA